MPRNEAEIVYRPTDSYVVDPRHVDLIPTGLNQADWIPSSVEKGDRKVKAAHLCKIRLVNIPVVDDQDVVRSDSQGVP